MPTPLDKPEWVYPAIPWGEDAYVDLPGPLDASTWAIAPFCGFSPDGPVDSSLAGITATWLGGPKNLIRVTVPAGVTAPFTTARTIYADVWRTDAGLTKRLRLLAFPTCKPVRPTA